MLGITSNTYRNLLKSGNFRVSQLIKMAEIFDVHIIELIEGKESKYIIKNKQLIASEPEIKYNKKINDLENQVEYFRKKYEEAKDDIIKLLKGKKS